MRLATVPALALLVALATSPLPAVEIPATAAGQAFADWLAALDGARDDEAIAAYLEAHLGERFFDMGPMEMHVSMFREIAAELAGGEPAVIEVDTPLELVAVCPTRTGEWVRVVMMVQEEPPHRIDALGIREADPPGSEPEPAAGDAELVPAVRAYVDSIAAEGRFSGAVLVARRGVPIFEGAWGLAHRRYGVPNHLDTRFNLGSMNKMFTAVAVAQLVEQGKIGWDDRVGKHLPDYPGRRVRDDVTIRHLVTHTSGMGTHFTDAYMKASKLEYREPADYLPLFADEPLSFTPGERFAYSNAGFFVLGMIVEAVSGENYYDYIRAHVYAPAGMLATDSYDADGVDPDIAVGYYEEDGVIRENTVLHSIKGTPAGGGYSTVGDLNRFAQALLDGRLISRETLETMTAWTNERDGRPGSRRGYGYGFTLRESEDGIRSFGHGGGFPGINGMLEVYPDRGYAVVALANMDGGAEKVAARIAGMLPRE